jgi:hypothetical protein
MPTKVSGSLPVLVHTGHPDHPSISTAYNLRAHFLEKPSTAGQIHEFFRLAQRDSHSRRHATQTASEAPEDPRAETCSVAAAILREQRTAAAETLRSFWRIGDLIAKLRADTEPGRLRAALAECATSLGVHTSWLDEAAKAAAIVSERERRTILEACERGRADLTPSHIAELARAGPRARREAIATLLNTPLSVRQLRNRLRG